MHRGRWQGKQLTVDPGASLRIPVSLSTGDAQDTLRGTIAIVYRTADGKLSAPNGQLLLSVAAEIASDFRVSSRQLDFGELDGISRQRVTKRLSIIPEVMDEVILDKLESSSELFTASIIDADSKQFGEAVRVTMDASQLTESRAVNESLILYTNSRRTPKLRVHLIARYRSPVEFSPPAIIVTSDAPRIVIRRITLQTCCPARIARVSTSAPSYTQIYFDKDKLGCRHRVTVKVSPCRDKHLDCVVNLDLNLYPENRPTVVRSVAFPIHRFPEKGV